MPALWTGNRTTGVANLGLGLSVLRGQILAIGVSVAVLATVFALRPILGHSVYLLCAPAMLACALLGGPAAALTSTLLMAIGGITLDSLNGFDPVEETLRVVAFLVLGLGAAWGMARLVVERNAAA